VPTILVGWIGRTLILPADKHSPPNVLETILRWRLFDPYSTMLACEQHYMQNGLRNNMRMVYALTLWSILRVATGKWRFPYWDAPGFSEWGAIKGNANVHYIRDILPQMSRPIINDATK
jgi:hypothetical protein